MNKRHNNQPNNQLSQAVRTLCGRRSGLSAPAFALLGFSMVSVAVAGPTGGVVVTGDATISTPAAGTTVIDQSSQHVQLNWNTFDVAANESVQFNQPNSSSVALNRILDQNPSQIFGRIDANGQVILVNPNGMLFGASAQLNVGSLVASSLDVVGFDAATGRYTFGTSNTDVGAIVNNGAITAASGGSVTLLGGRVTNDGSIIANFGTVNLAAGRAATLDLAGDGLLRLEVDGELVSNNAGASAAVENSGVIEANGGQVLLTAQAVDGVFANLVNNTGVVRANRIDNSGGTIRLMGAGGTVRSSGVLDASAGDAVSSGGRVEMLGEQVGLFDSALVDVSGATSGGTALIGGDYQGKNPDVLNAERTYVSANASIRADAGLTGDGGRVIVWADEITRFSGSISARGGASSGNGGFAEVSGKEHLVFRGRADLTAAHGDIGSLLLDPTNITINNSSTTDSDVSDGTYAFAEDTGDATIGNSAIETLLGTTNVVLQATNDITQNANATIDVSGRAAASGRSLTLEAGGDITLNGDIITNNGAVNLIADSAASPGTGGDGSGAITMQNGSSINAGSADVTLTGAQNIRLTSITTTGDVNVTSSAGAIVDDSDNTTRIAAASLTLSAGTAIGASATNAQIDTSVNVLSATAAAGSVYIRESNAVTLLNVSAAGAGNDVNVSNITGAMVVANVSAADAVTLTAVGAINDDTLESTRIVADTLTLDAGTSIGSSAANGQIDTSVNSLSATADAGSIYISEQNGVTLTDVSAEAAGSDVHVTSIEGSIVVGSVTAADAVTLNAMSATTGAITDDDDDDTRIVAGALTLIAGTAIGASGVTGQVDIDVTSLTATADAGSVYIGELDGLTLQSVSALGAGSDINVTSESGNIGVVAVTAADEVSLTTTGSITDDSNDSTRITAATATLSAGLGIGSNASSAQIDTDVTSLTATADAGSVHIIEANGLTLTSVSAAGAGSDVNVTSNTGDIVVNTVAAVDVVNLSALTGAITDDGDNATRITAQTLTMDAGTTIGAAGANEEVDTDVTSLSASTDAGGIYVDELNGVTLSAVNAGGAGSDVNVRSVGTITVGSVSAADEVTLHSTAGYIRDDFNNATRIATQTATLTGSQIGDSGVGGQIDTDVTSLIATGSAGSVYIGESNGLTLTSISAVGTGNDVIVTSSTGDIVVNTVAAVDAVTLTATTGAITDDGDNATLITAATLAMDAGSAIGAGGATDQIDTDVVSLSADADAGGVYIGELSGVTLTNVSAGGAGSDVNVTSATGDITANTVEAGDAVTLTATAGNIAVANISAANAVTLSATVGAITDDGLNSTRINTGTLTLTAGTAIGVSGANGEIDTNVSSLSAATTTGGVHIGELNGLTLTNVSAAGAGNDVIVTSATGNIVAGNISAGNLVSLTATNGAITDDDNDASVVSGGSVALSAATNIGTVVDFDADNDADVGSSVDVQTNGTLTASVASNNGQINLNISGAPIFAAGAIALGSGSNRAGAIVLQSAGDLNVAGLPPGAINIGSNNTTQLGLRSGGVLTLPSSGGFTDQPVDRLLVRGATDVVDNDGTPREFALTATSLDFRSGAAGGATVLNTNVAQLSAVLGNNQNLTINETNGVTLGRLDVGNGNITLTAGGAVADDGDDLTRIVSNIATLSGTSLGTSGNALDTQVNTLTAATTSGGVYINETDALSVTVNALGGAADVRTANGSLTVASATGNDVTLIAGGAGSDLTVNGAVNAGAGDVTLTAGTAASRGAIVAGVGNQITGGSLIATGSMIGTGAARLNTTVATLDATSTNGGIFITESDALTLAANAAGGAVDVQTTNGVLTVTSATGTGVTLTSGGDGNGLIVNGAVNSGGGDMSLTASGAGSSITLNNAVNAGTGNVTLTAGTAASRGAIVAGAGNQITGGSLTAIGSTVGTGAARLNTSVASLNATSTNGGIFVTESDALNLTANATGGTVDVRTTNGALTVAQATGNVVTLAAGGAGNGLTVNGAVNASAGDVTLTAGGAGGGITLNNVVNAGTGNVTLTAGTAASRGAIVAGAGNQIIAGSLTATGSMIGTSAARLNTTVASLDAATTNGGIFVTESDALSLTANASGGTVDVQTTNGALTVTSVTGAGVTLTSGGAGSGIALNGAVNAGTGNVTLTAGTVASRGAIVAGVGSQITGGSLTATGSTIGTSAARLNTTVASLDATSSNGGIFVTESNALNLTANATGGAVDVQTTNGALTVTRASGTAVTLTTAGAGNGITLNGAVNVNALSGDVTLTAGGAGSGITLNGSVNAGTGDVTLTAGTAASRGAIVASAGNQITASSLTATGSTIGTSAARLNTTVASLNATSTNGGISINETDALILTANASGGAVDVQTTNGALTVTSATGAGVTLAAGGAGNGITLNGVVSAGANDITLNAGTAASRGAIVGAAGHSISGRSLTANAASIGASSARLNTSIDTLTAAASTGDIYITEQNGLTLANASAARDIDVNSVAGDIVVNTVAASNDVRLTAAAGAIADDGNDSTRLSANALTLSARWIGAASTLSGSTLNSAGRLDTDVETLNATSTAGGIFIDEANGLDNVNVQASGGEAGDIELLTRAGDLILGHVNASDTLLLAAGRNIYAAPGASPVTARVAELRAGTTDPTGGQIGTASDLIEFQLSAGNSLRLFVPQTINPNDPNRAPATLPSAGVTTTLSLFSPQNEFAALAGFNQFQGLGDQLFTSPAETLVRALQNQTGTVQAGLDIDWGSFDPEVSLFGTLEPSVCLPGDQRDEEASTPTC